ncbi:hypothetical protein Gotri_012580 [Gossypium trilobum]|uniref:DUF4283 domain-containing protein n=1 Tax=Gossypium trilobum TaxID=34281 RepID=A0A7J9DQQ7_9ROSI|nr:hypothetical protein [Gossypium trilobum]
MLPFVKGQELDGYVFNITPFWIRIYNIPLEQRDRQVAIDVGKTIEEVVAIDWRDRNGAREGEGRMKYKRKRTKGSNRERNKESLTRLVRRKLVDSLSPYEAVASDQPYQKQ